MNEVPSGVAVWVSGKDTEQCIEMAVNMWVKECPEEVRLTTRHIREKKDSLYRSNGMSKEGNMKELLEIPRGLHKRMTRMTGKDDWFQEKKLRDKFIQLCPGLLTYDPKARSYI